LEVLAVVVAAKILILGKRTQVVAVAGVQAVTLEVLE
jgi:hypothetical protein